MLRHKSGFSVLASILSVVVLLAGYVSVSADSNNKRQDPAAADNGRDVTILVTPEMNNSKEKAAAASLKADDFAVRENGLPQSVVSVKPAAQQPPVIEVLIQDDLTSRLDNEIKGIKSFITELPEGSLVMTGYITTGSLRVAQDFTADRQRAAASLRVILGAQAGSPYDPYIELSEALHRFDKQPAGRRIVLFISDGLDTSHGFWDAEPSQSTDLARAIRDAQARSVAVFSFFAPGVFTRRVSMATNFGQGSLDKLTHETGGTALFEGTTLVTFDPFLRELRGLLSAQWLVTYHSQNTGAGFREIKVTTESGAHLMYPRGYWAKESAQK
jgi:VWFA-related protein